MGAFELEDEEAAVVGDAGGGGLGKGRFVEAAFHLEVEGRRRCPCRRRLEDEEIVLEGLAVEGVRERPEVEGAVGLDHEVAGEGGRQERRSGRGGQLEGHGGPLGGLGGAACASGNDGGDGDDDASEALRVAWRTGLSGLDAEQWRHGGIMADVGGDRSPCFGPSPWRRRPSGLFRPKDWAR